MPTASDDVRETRDRARRSESRTRRLQGYLVSLALFQLASILVWGVGAGSPRAAALVLVAPVFGALDASGVVPGLALVTTVVLVASLRWPEGLFSAVVGHLLPGLWYVLSFATLGVAWT